MKKPAKKKLPSKPDTGLLGNFFKGARVASDARLAKKGITKITPSAEVKAPASYARKAARAKERRKAKIKTLPAKYKSALSKFGLAKADSVVKRRGTYYTAAGAYQLRQNGLAASRAGVEVQNVYAWTEAAGRPGWFVVTINGEVQPKLKRWAEVEHAQRQAWRTEKIRAVAEKTGKSRGEIRHILAKVRAQEERKLKRFRTTKKYKGLTRAERRKHNINSRMSAIFGAICDLLELYGSPKTKREE